MLVFMHIIFVCALAVDFSGHRSCILALLGRIGILLLVIHIFIVCHKK